MKYWIGRNGQQLGPYAAADVQRMVQEGNIVATDLAWTEGMAAWAPALEIFKPAAAPSQSDDLAKTRPILAQEYRPPQSAAPAASSAAPLPASEPAPSPVTSTPAPAPVATAPAASSPASSALSSPTPASPAPAPSFSPMPVESGLAAPIASEPAPYTPPAAAQPPWSPAPSPQPAQQAPWNAPAQSPQPVPQQQPAQPPWSPQPAPAAPVSSQQPWSPSPAPAAPWTPQQQYAPPPAATPMGGPVPSGMHWALVLVLGYITFGIFFWYWMFKEVNFVQQLDPRTQAKKLFLMGLGLYVLCIVLLLGSAVLAAVTQDITLTLILGPLGYLGMLGGAVCIILSMFKARASLVQYYNTVEPIGLRLSGVMTFFFHVLYFQHHFKRIHDWKTTGQLVPQQVR